ncbi:hypothetical protein E2C01_028181 [Portunus trituberculatus]|uniref:Uncharacterized protein n=1 Tax=Portunus trituberculatus TaxID=210409 RepID=A0A5B7EJT6_PORTR|nr:hypothetical protein [Portunus trituberculatus]
MLVVKSIVVVVMVMVVVVVMVVSWGGGSVVKPQTGSRAMPGACLGLRQGHMKAASVTAGMQSFERQTFVY